MLSWGNNTSSKNYSIDTTFIQKVENQQLLIERLQKQNKELLEQNKAIIARLKILEEK